MQSQFLKLHFIQIVRDSEAPLMIDVSMVIDGLVSPV